MEGPYFLKRVEYLSDKGGGIMFACFLFLSSVFSSFLYFSQAFVCFWISSPTESLGAASVFSRTFRTLSFCKTFCMNSLFEIVAFFHENVEYRPFSNRFIRFTTFRISMKQHSFGLVLFARKHVLV